MDSGNLKFCMFMSEADSLKSISGGFSGLLTRSSRLPGKVRL